MCGINGFNFSDEKLIRKMNNKVKHRGPDGDGVFVCDEVSLGHTRLAIIDLSDKASQPMLSSDADLVLVFNGEIYNFQVVKNELESRGYKFYSDSDSEVILNAYKEYGVDCLQKFNGIFAFAIYNKKDKSLFLARDRIGVKPLYYYWDGNKFIFSSEIKAILEHNIERKINLDALNIYLRMLYVPAPLTMFEGIKKLEPGSYLIFKNKTLVEKKYWEPKDFKNLKNEEDAEKKIKELLKDSVRLQLVSDRPVGVFLSGGIDSTIITGLIKEITESTVKTFSANYDIKVDKFNVDADLAKKTSEYYKTDHTEIEITGKDVRDNIFDVIYAMDEPVANATTVSTYLLSKKTSQDVAVVLGGDGGDELFCGYERYRLNEFINNYQKLPKFLRIFFGNTIVKLLKKKNKPVNKLNLPKGVDRLLSFLSQKEEDVASVLRKDINNKEITKNFYREKYFTQNISDDTKQFMWADVRSWLVDESLVRSDKMSMAFGLEQRVPILDHRLVELSLKIPTGWKMKGKNKKVIFKDALKEYVPDYIMNQPKRGWMSPASEWLRRDLKELAYEVLSSDYNLATQNLFNFDIIKKMLDDHIEKRQYNMNLLWALIIFQIWYKQYFLT